MRCVNVVGGVVSVAGDQAVVEVLLQNGADPNANRDGWTALMWAAGNGSCFVAVVCVCVCVFAMC